GNVRRGQYLQRGNRATQDTYLETEVGSDARRQRAEDRRGVVAGAAAEQFTKGVAQLMGGSSGHGSPVCYRGPENTALTAPLPGHKRTPFPVPAGVRDKGTGYYTPSPLSARTPPETPADVP